MTIPALRGGGGGGGTYSWTDRGEVGVLENRGRDGGSVRGADIDDGRYLSRPTQLLWVSVRGGESTYTRARSAAG